MNKERMRKLADYIDHQGREVEMGEWASKSLYNAKTRRECGTAGCAAGWCTIMNLPEYKAKISDAERFGHFWPGPDDFSKQWLELSDREANALFTPRGFYSEDDDGRPLRNRPDKQTQKSRLLKVLRGKKPLNQKWLMTP